MYVSTLVIFDREICIDHDYVWKYESLKNKSKKPIWHNVYKSVCHKLKIQQTDFGWRAVNCYSKFLIVEKSMKWRHFCYYLSSLFYQRWVRYFRSFFNNDFTSKFFFCFADCFGAFLTKERVRQANTAGMDCNCKEIGLEWWSNCCCCWCNAVHPKRRYCVGRNGLKHRMERINGNILHLALNMMKK